MTLISGCNIDEAPDENGSGIWFTEEDDRSLRFSYRIRDVLFRQRSEWQDVQVIDTEAYGKMLLLDGFVMTTERDEFVYHEMITHIPLAIHRAPKNVVVIGGGDGGTVRELVRHQELEKITLCEIDGLVIDACRRFFPDLVSGLDDPRVDLRVADGVAYMKELENEVDVVIIDSTDPIGPGEGLFTADFYRSVAAALRPGGLMVAQSESPWYRDEILQRIHRNIKGGFPYLRSYIGSVPTYPRGLWSWTLASQDPINPGDMDEGRLQTGCERSRYLTADVAHAAFALPKFYQRKIAELVE